MRLGASIVIPNSKSWAFSPLCMWGKPCISECSLAWPLKRKAYRNTCSRGLWLEWTPSLFSPQTVQTAVWSGSWNRFPGIPSAPSITTVSKRTTGGNLGVWENQLCSAAKLPSRKTSPDTAILVPFLTWTLNQGFSIRTPSESAKAGMTRSSWFAKLKEQK